MKRIELYENSIHMLWEVTETGEIKLLHFSALPFEEENLTSETGTQSFRWKYWLRARTGWGSGMVINISRLPPDTG